MVPALRRDDAMRIRPKLLLLLVSPFLLLVAAAYIQWGVAGLPRLSSSPAIVERAAGPAGFPAWLRITHYVNFLFLILLVRSGLQILMDHPRLYWNVHCTPGTGVAPADAGRGAQGPRVDGQGRLPLPLSLDRPARLPAHRRHGAALALPQRAVLGGQRPRLRRCCCSARASGGGWCRRPGRSCPMPGPSSSTTPLSTCRRSRTASTTTTRSSSSRTSAVVFVLAPLAILTGPSMSPALTNRFPWYPKLPGNRQIGRSIHFLVMCAFVVFHRRSCGDGRDHRIGSEHEPHRAWAPTTPAGSACTSASLGIAVVVVAERAGELAAWRRPRAVQQRRGRSSRRSCASCSIAPRRSREFAREDISPFFWPNGRMPTCEEWKTLAADEFEDYRLKVYGLVENPVELSLDDLRALGKKTQITLHHCIQGWSGIAEWGGLSPGGTDEAGPSEAGREGGRLLLVRRGRRVSTGVARHVLRQPLDRERAAPADAAGLRDELRAARASARGAACGCASRTSSASRWSSGSRRSSSWRASGRSRRAKGATTRTTSTSASWPTSNRYRRETGAGGARLRAGGSRFG